MNTPLHPLADDISLVHLRYAYIASPTLHGRSEWAALQTNGDLRAPYLGRCTKATGVFGRATEHASSSASNGQQHINR